MNIVIWVDDVRPILYFPDINGDCKIINCRNYARAIAVLDEVKSTYTDDRVFLFLDHDLGETKTGYDVAKYVVENQIPLAGFYCHSLNVVGKQNIEQLLTHYNYKLIKPV